MISRQSGASWVVLGLAIAVLLINATASIGSASQCAKKLSETIPQELTAAGAMQHTACGVDEDGHMVYKPCPSHYWRKPPHKECESGGDGYCCRNVAMNYEYRRGTCVLPWPGTCTYGALDTPPPGEVPLQYIAATILPCNGSEPHPDCGNF